MESWIVLILGVVGFLLTWTGMVVSVTKAVNAIKSDTQTRISEETTKITDRLNKIAEQFEEDQRSQDNRFAEVALSIRQYVANVEKEMHQIEIWGRDHFVLKSDFLDVTKRLEDALQRLAYDMKDDFKSMFKRLDDFKKE